MPIEMMGLTAVSDVPGGVRESQQLSQLQQAFDGVAQLADTLTKLVEQEREQQQRVQHLLDKARQWLNSVS